MLLSVILMAADPGYEIPPHLYSRFKPTRTLIAKAIGREKRKIWRISGSETMEFVQSGEPGAPKPRKSYSLGKLGPRDAGHRGGGV